MPQSEKQIFKYIQPKVNMISSIRSEAATSKDFIRETKAATSKDLFVSSGGNFKEFIRK